MIELWLRQRLSEGGYIQGAEVEISLMQGGVSSDVMLVRDGTRRFIVKRALKRLKVEDVWECDPRRSENEYRAIEYVARIMPDAVPRLIGSNPREHFLVMEYLEEPFCNWKEQLMAGRVEPQTAWRAGKLLATLHDGTWHDRSAADRFETTDDFFALRLDPYLRTTASRHADLGAEFAAEAERLVQTRLALVHGDFSSKNLMVAPDRLVILDWEVAWYGDPAFDAAFLLNLLYLKSLRLPPHADLLIQSAQRFRSAYQQNLTHYDDDLDARICRLMLMLMLARVDGKSPAEYLVGNDWETQRGMVRRFVREMLQRRVTRFDTVDAEWKERLTGHGN